MHAQIQTHTEVSCKNDILLLHFNIKIEEVNGEREEF